MNKKYLFILSLLLPPAMTNAQENILDMTTARDADTSRKWTLHDCITHALNNNITLKKNNVAILSSKENVEQAKAALLPSLSASTNQSIGWRPWNEAGVSTVANGTVVNKVSKTYYNGNYALNAQAETEKAKMQLKQILELQGDMTFDIVIPEKKRP